MSAEIERRPVSKLTEIAIRQLNEKLGTAMQEILVAAAEAEGVDPADGWRYDPQSQGWARQAPQAPIAP